MRKRAVGADDDSHVTVANLARKASRDYRDAYERAMAEFRTRYPEEELVKLIQDRGVEAADGIDFRELEILFASIAAIHFRTARGAGAATAIGISEATGEAMDFAMTAEMVDKLRGEITDGLELIIQATDRGADQMVRIMLEEGLTPEEAGKRLHKILGIDQNRGRKWRKFERQMRNAGLLDDLAMQDRIDEMAEALLWERARSIGGDQIWAGAQQGRQFGLEQAVGLGILSSLSVKIWNTMLDELVCPRCGPMHGQRVPIMFSFQSPYDGSSAFKPPLHPLCRCWTTWTMF